MPHIVIVGAGQAAASCCAKLRSEGFDDEITLIGAEPVPPYQRPPLSKGYLLGDMALERLFLRPAAWYEENRITLRLGTRVTGLRPDLKQIELEAREMLAYDDLVLATGAHPRTLPTEAGGMLDGVFYVRDLADTDAMEPAFAEGRKLLVIGGGYIGLEAAAVARKRGMEVTLVEAGPRILGRVACAETADAVRVLHAEHGVTIREGVGLVRLIGTDKVEGAELSDGTLMTADAVVVGIGVEPASVLAEAAGLEIDNGIACDAHGQTSAPHVWAAGDCASFPAENGRMRLESVGGAIDMGEHVARAILGDPAPYVPRPWFWSDQYDLKLQIAGLGTRADRIVTRPGLSHWYYRGKTLLAVDALNDPRAYMVGKRLIEVGKSPAPEAVADPDTPLKSLL